MDSIILWIKLFNFLQEQNQTSYNICVVSRIYVVPEQLQVVGLAPAQYHFGVKIGFQDGKYRTNQSFLLLIKVSFNFSKVIFPHQLMSFKRYDNDEDEELPGTISKNDNKQTKTNNQFIFNKIDECNKQFDQLEKSFQKISKILQGVDKSNASKNIQIYQQAVTQQQDIERQLLIGKQQIDKIQQLIDSTGPDDRGYFIKGYDALLKQNNMKQQQFIKIQENIQKVYQSIQKAHTSEQGPQKSPQSPGIISTPQNQLQMQQMNDDLEMEEKSIKQINRDIRDLNMLHQHLAEEVDKQQETLNIIENNVNDADVNTNQAHQHIQATRKQQIKKNKCLWIGISILLILIIIIVVSVVCT